MAGYKVEICGVNTAKLPLLTNEEKDALFKRILEEIPKPERNTSGEICGWYSASSSVFQQQRKYC